VRSITSAGDAVMLLLQCYEEIGASPSQEDTSVERSEWLLLLKLLKGWIFF